MSGPRIPAPRVLQGAIASLALGATLLGLALLAAPALAQIGGPEQIGTPDSVFAEQPRIPISYSTTYDRGATTTTWGQSLTWGLSRKRLSLSTNASSVATRNLKTNLGRNTSGQIGTQISMVLVPRWILSANGQFSSVVPHGTQQDALQRRNRLQLQTQYEVDPTSTLSLRALVSSEFRRDFDETERLRQDLVVASTDTLRLSRLDTSARTIARQDGASGQLQWKPAKWIQANVTGNWSRARPTTRIDSLFTATLLATGAPAQLRSTGTLEEPIAESRMESSLGITGAHGFSLGATLRAVESGHIYFDPGAGREHWSLNSRYGSLHVEHAPIPGLSYSLDGSISRASNEFATRRTSTNRTDGRSAVANIGWNRPGTSLSLMFNVQSSEVGQQVDRYGAPDPLRNGETIVRFLTASGSRRLSRRLKVDGVATASLFSSLYQNPKNDHDLARTFLSAGGGYSVSPQCSLTVHFSTNRSFNRYIDASNSGSNNVVSDYQMLAVMNVRASRDITIAQNYLLSASYRIADDPRQESTNTLVRNRRIDTTAADTLFSFAYARLTHSFLFQDLGPFLREVPGQDRRYVVSSERYSQTIEAAFGFTPATGISLLVSQKLGNTRDHQLATGSRTTQNRWNLTAGMDLDRELPGGAALHASVQHIGEYSERPSECDGANPPPSCFAFDPQRSDYWVAGVALQRNF